ncbi:SRP40, C-terminal domain-containing protein, partial [Schizophyllum commune]
MSDYGARAHQDLIVTRGAGFRKEKNKKKRGSYRGGEITVRTLTRFTDGVAQYQVHLRNS